MRNFKRMSVVLSLAIALTSVFSNVAFAVQRSLTWDDIPNLFFDDPQKPPKDMPVDNPENPDYDDTTDEGIDTGKNDENGPGECFDLPETAGNEELTGGEEFAEESAGDELTNEEIASEAFSDEEIISEEAPSDEEATAEEAHSDEEIAGEVLEETSEVPAEGAEEVVGEEATAELSSTVRKDYQQPSFYVKQGYDAISAFVTNDMSNTAYTGKIYFIRNTTTNQWLMYNYKPETAALYFDKVEDENNLKVPSKEADTRDDAAGTPINEAKVPLITYTSFMGMYCNWRTIDNIPFTKDANGNYLYATYEVQDNGNGGEEGGNGKEQQGTTVSPNSYYKYTVSLNNGNTYRVYVSKGVSYNGKKHVLSTAKAGKGKTPDIKVYVYLNGQQVDPKLYKVQFKNNKNCNGYGGNEKVFPYIRIKLKFKNKALKKDIKAIYKKGFGFRINPISISSGTISCKGFDKKGGLKKPTFTGKDGNTIKLTPPKGNKGDYTLSYDNGKTTITGRNNFYGTATFDSTPNYNSNKGGSQIY
ncbi:hypothetical protein IJG27_04020 [Candidatus Saccharibacteria bacterium]|nr:hypothetical protein [Candidatus Saccharibacteria bacterium]